MHTSVSTSDLLSILQDRFGHEQFRPGQEQIVRQLLSGRDVLAVLPTGAGKSLVYQLTSQLLPGVTVVVSPLLALMKDQVDSLAELGLDAQAINSLQSETAAREAIDQAVRGDVKLLYVTPERFQDAEFMEEARQFTVSLLVVDEAHSISEWGHSFRPAYLGLASAIEQLGRPIILALTATATHWVRRDIVEHLRMRDPALIVRGTDRPNLFLEVVRVEDEREEKVVLRNLFDGQLPDGAPAELRELMGGSGIIYTATTRAARETASWLKQWGIPADYYHGQRRKADRERVQTAFMDGQLRVVVATNAFGLGVDKADVRFVIHRDVPASVEAYYQEAGRAGRDGELGRCVLIFRPGDLGRAAFLGSSGGDDEQRAYERSRLEMMRAYAELRDCRRRYVLNYFGEEPEWERCERCDVDVQRSASPPEPLVEAPAAEAGYALNDRVEHVSLGRGLVQRVAGDTLTVLFDEAGYKTLDVELVQDQNLLRKLAGPRSSDRLT